MRIKKNYIYINVIKINIEKIAITGIILFYKYEKNSIKHTTSYTTFPLSRKLQQICYIINMCRWQFL